MNITNNKRSMGALALTAALAAMLLPVAAHADSQSNKNLWRNLGIGGAAVGAYGLLHHNTGLGLLGLAGGAYAASRYEHDRHTQSVASHRRSIYYHRQTQYGSTVGNYTRGNRRYYLYQGHQYYENLDTGARHRAY